MMKHGSRLLLVLVLTSGLSIAPIGIAGSVHAASVASKAAHGTQLAGQSRAAALQRAGVRDGGTIRTHAELTNGQVQVFFAPDDLAVKLNVSTATLLQDLQSGETLLQIAGSAYSSASDLATALIAPFKDKMDHAVAAGVFTADQASQQYTAMLNSVETLVVTPHPQLASASDPANAKTPSDSRATDSQPPTELMTAKKVAAEAIATGCNTTVDAFYNALQAGSKSPLEVCQITNPSATVDSVSAAITSALTAQLNADVSAGKTTSADANTVLTDMQGHISSWLTSPFGTGKG